MNYLVPHSVKPAIFDLVLALGIVVYIIGVYFFVIVCHMRVLHCISCSFSLEFFDSSSNTRSIIKEKIKRRLDKSEIENIILTLVINYSY